MLRVYHKNYAEGSKKFDSDEIGYSVTGFCYYFILGRDLFMYKNQNGEITKKISTDSSKLEFSLTDFFSNRETE